jgi:chloramphenicol O-acetyltransferase type A
MKITDTKDKETTMREIDSKKTNRALSYEMFINAPMPMVTIFKTIDVTPILKKTEQGYKFNMLMCYCIGKAASSISEFSLLPVGKKMIAYDKLGINIIVKNHEGSINSCDVQYTEDLRKFNSDYLRLTGDVYDKCYNYNIKDSMIVGTSNLAKYNIDGAVNMYSGIFNNPFVVWGKYFTEKEMTKLKLSFQFHHVQMDGEQACQFLDKLEKVIGILANSEDKK